MSINISTSAGFFPWRPAAWLGVIGSDAFSFLQGQFTNDLRALEQQPAVYGLWLNVKAKVLADSFVLRGAAQDEFWIGSYFSSASVIRERLESHVIADDVTVEDHTAAWEAVSLFGDDLDRWQRDGPGDGFVFGGRRTRGQNLEWVFPSREGPAVRERLRDRDEIGADDITRARIADGIPAVPIDIGPGDLPNEGGLEEDAISFTKGCYLGQEIIARLKAMGQVRRRLVGVRSAGGDTPALPAPLFSQGRQVGELRSVAGDRAGGFAGLAMVSLLHVGPDAVLAFAADAPPTVRRVGAP